jgi:hypothetical protein
MGLLQDLRGMVSYNFLITSKACGGTNGMPVLAAILLYSSARLTA